MEKGSVDQDPADRRRDDPDEDQARLIAHASAKHSINSSPTRVQTHGMQESEDWLGQHLALA